MASFSASNISRLLAGGDGKTAASYCLELALLELGIKDEVQTVEMKHGIANQLDGFMTVIQPLYSSAVWFDESLPINDYCSASPDFLISGGCGDMKLPYYIDTYLEQIKTPPKKYIMQVQMQMMAVKEDRGLLCFYLTKPELWGEDVWEEYPMPLSDRYSIFEYDADHALHDRILSTCEAYLPKKNNLVSLLKNAQIIDEIEFFYMQMKGDKFRNIKKCSNIFGLEKVYRVKDNFYYVKQR